MDWASTLQMLILFVVVPTTYVMLWAFVKWVKGEDRWRR